MLNEFDIQNILITSNYQNIAREFTGVDIQLFRQTKCIVIIRFLTGLS